MRYYIYVYNVGASVPDIERTGSIATAERTAVEYSRDEYVAKVVVKDIERGTDTTFENGKQTDFFAY